MHDDVAAVGTRYRALDEQQPTRRVDPYHLQCLHGALDVAILTRHALARKHASRILCHADGAGRVVRARVAVRCAIGAEIVALYHAGESAPLGRARDIDELSDGECLEADRLAYLEGG